MSRRCQSPSRRTKSHSRRSVRIFAAVTAKIEPAILKHFTKQELDTRLNQVSQEASVEVIKDGIGFAFKGKWGDVAYAQAVLRSMYVRGVCDGIEDRLFYHHDDDSVSLRTSKCGSICSVSSSSSRAKINVGNLSERVSMTLEKSSSLRSISLSEKSGSKPTARSGSDNVSRSIPLKPRNTHDDMNTTTPKRTSLFSNLVHHKKFYIAKCAAFQNEENDCEPAKQNEDQPMPLVQGETPRPKQEATPTQCTEPQTFIMSKEVPEPVPSMIHYDPVYEPSFRPEHYSPKLVENTYPEPSCIPYPRGYGLNAPHQRIGPVLPGVHPETHADVFSSRLVPPPQPAQHPGFTFESVTHETFFYQNHAYLPHAMPFFAEPPVQAAPPPGPPKWEVMDATPPMGQTPRTDFGYELCDYIQRKNQPSPDKRELSERIIKCHICDAILESVSDLKLHMRTHSTKHRCDECGKTYKSVRVLKKHQLTHEGSYVKPTFRCNECGKTFSTKYVLQNHVDNIHKGKEPAFVCRVCDKHFTQKHSLTEHQNIHLGLKPFKCETCQKSFSFRTSLSQHILLHGAERHFRCEVCGKSFLQKNSLRLHSAIHSDNRAHCCSYCGKGFTQKQAMLRHERIHNGEKPYSCDICGRAFNDSSILRRHMHVHRKNEVISAAHAGPSTSNSFMEVREMCQYPQYTPEDGGSCRALLADTL